MRTQGYLWRELITGEKAAVDMLNLSGYLTAARQIARRAWPVIVAVALIAVGVVVAMFLLHSIPPTARLIAALAWIGGTLLAALKASGRADRLGGQGRRRVAVADRAGRVRGAGRDPAAAARPAPPHHRLRGRRHDAQREQAAARAPAEAPATT